MAYNNNNNIIYVLIEFRTTGTITGHHYNGPIDELRAVSSLIENTIASTATGRTFFFLVKQRLFKKRTINLYIIPLFYNCVHRITSTITLSRYKTYYYRMYRAVQSITALPLRSPITKKKRLAIPLTVRTCFGQRNNAGIIISISPLNNRRYDR